jgi:hypothetical protein
MGIPAHEPPLWDFSNSQRIRSDKHTGHQKGEMIETRLGQRLSWIPEPSLYFEHAAEAFCSGGTG